MNFLSSGLAALYEPEHEDFRESARRYLRTEVLPQRQQWRDAGAVPRRLFADLAKIGAIGLAVGEAEGGAAIKDPRFRAVLSEEAVGCGLDGIALMLIAHDDLGVELLTDAAAGPAPAGALSGETVIGWSPGPVTAVADGARLSGEVNGVINGNLADLVIVAARSEGEPALFVIDPNAEQVKRRRSSALVGPEPCDRADFRFSGVAAQRLERSYAQARRVEQMSIAIAARAGARNALNLTLAYTAERRAFGQLISEFENSRVVLAELAAELTLLDLFIERCLRAATDGSLTGLDAAIAALRATAAYRRAADQGVQLHGGYGYMFDYEIAHSYAASGFFAISAGGSAAARSTIAAELLR